MSTRTSSLMALTGVVSMGTSTEILTHGFKSASASSDLVTTSVEKPGLLDFPDIEVQNQLLNPDDITIRELEF